VSIHGHDTHSGALGVVYHIDTEDIITVASVCLDWGVDAIEIPLDSILIHDSIPQCNFAWDDIFNNKSEDVI
jgi:2-keto-3-deoxy-6-phosphogluconate aldolase